MGPSGRAFKQARPLMAAVPAPGHFGAAIRCGPTVRLKCTASNSTSPCKYSDGESIFTDNSAGCHLETNSFHQHVRLLMEISPHTFFLKKYFDPMEEYVFQ